MFEIKFIPQDNIKSIIPLVTLLNPGTDEKILENRLEQMLKNNYKCIGVYDTSASLSAGNEKLIGICGLWTLVKFYNGKHLEPDNVVIHPDYRNKGVGELLVKWIDTYAKEQNCEVIELNAYIENAKGLEFWKRNGYFIRGHHFQKPVEKDK